MNCASCIYGPAIRSLRFSYTKPNELSLEIKSFSTASKLCSLGESSFSYKCIFSKSARSKIWQNLKTGCNERLILLGEILTKQFNFYAAQRIRRMSQIWNLYTRLYNENTIKQIVSKFARSLQEQRKRRLTFLLGVALFSWEKEKITDQEIQSSVSELDRLQGAKDSSQLPKIYACALTEKLIEDGWEVVIEKDCLQLWRKSLPNSYLYEYKILGTFFDVPARTFFRVQTDLEYRKKWDKLVIKLDVIDKNEDGDCEVVHWVMHYPYPMYSRDYVYIRRAVIDTKTNTMVLVSRAIEHPCCPVDKKYVRVQKYSSRMVIRPHKTFDENGFDYVLTYFDDPQAAFPTPAYNWMAASGVPDFVEQLHSAAQELHIQQKRNKSYTKTSSHSSHSSDMEYAYI